MIYIRSAVHGLQDFDGERASSQCFKFMFTHHQRIRWKPLTIVGTDWISTQINIFFCVLSFILKQMRNYHS